jgi:hypothetical protein
LYVEPRSFAEADQEIARLARHEGNRGLLAKRTDAKDAPLARRQGAVLDTLPNMSGLFRKSEGNLPRFSDLIPF